MSNNSDISLEKSLIIWLNSLLLNDESTKEYGNINEIEDTSDGISLFLILQILDPIHFNINHAHIELSVDTQLKKINNIRKLIESLEVFFNETNVFSDDKNTDLSFIDVSAIAQKDDRSELMKLFELVVVAAVNTSNKEIAVEAIMNLDADIQHQLMFVIQDTVERFKSLATETSDKRRNSNRFSSSIDAEEYNDLKAQVSNLRQTNNSLKEKNNTLSKENKDLKGQIHLLEEQINEIRLKAEADKTNAIESTTNRLEEKRKAEESRISRQLVETKAQTHELTSEINVLKEKLSKQERQSTEEIATLQNELDKMHDELDLMSEKAKKLVSVEKTLERYKQRVNELSESKVRVAELEKELSDTKSKLATSGASSDQIVAFKQMVSDLKTKLRDKEVQYEELEAKKDEAVDEVIVLKERLHNTTINLEALEAEKRSTMMNTPSAAAVVSPAASSMLHSEWEERLDELEKENTNLKEQLAMAQVGSLASDDHEADIKRLKDKINELQKQHRESRREAMRLKHELDAAKSNNNNSNQLANEHTQTVAKLQQENEALKILAEKTNKQSSINNSNQGDKSLQIKYKELHGHARRLKDMNTQLKQQIKELHEKLQAEINKQKQLRDKEKRNHRNEQQLMSGAFYELGAELQYLVHVKGQKQKTTGVASGKSPHRNSWLNQQRHHRRGPSVNL